jgi:trigger factor
VKITAEKRPKSLLVLDIELDQDRVEKGLERAARRLAQKYNVPGFRKGKAPRFIIENYFGRAALLEEASQDLIDRSFREALEQENIYPVGQASLESIDPSDTFRFKVAVPVSPTVEVADHRDIRVPLEMEPVTDEAVERTMEMRLENHVALKELEEPRPAQKGDQLTVKLETFVDGESLEKHAEDEEIPDSTLVLEPERLVPELYEGLLGMNVDETREIVAHMPEDHESEDVRNKDVTFKVQLVGIQERMLPDWEELPVLEEFEGTLDDLRADVRKQLEENTRTTAEKNVVDAYIQQLVSQTDYDVPDVMIRETAEEMLDQQNEMFAPYGITLDQMLQYRGQTREGAVDELMPTAEDRLKMRLALQHVVQRERLSIEPEEIEEELSTLLDSYDEATRATIQQTMPEQLYTNVANAVLDRKLRERIVAIATGQAPELPADEETAEEEQEAEDSIAALEDTEGTESSESAENTARSVAEEEESQAIAARQALGAQSEEVPAVPPAPQSETGSNVRDT